jgi:hypothetical protein
MTPYRMFMMNFDRVTRANRSMARFALSTRGSIIDSAGAHCALEPTGALATDPDRSAHRRTPGSQQRPVAQPSPCEG